MRASARPTLWYLTFVGAPQRILIVDDDPDVHQLLIAALAAPDRSIDSAYDGLEGLGRLEAAPYDLVLTDVNMPKLDGIALLARIQEIRPSTKVLVMTVANTPERVIQSIRNRAFAYFGKPFTLNVVEEMVERALHAVPSKDEIEVLSARPNWVELRLRCKMDTADRILQFLRELRIDLPPPEEERVAMAFREILFNAIEHGGKSDPQNTVTITYVRAEKAILYRVRDPGAGFSLEKLAHAAVSNPLDSPMAHAEVRERLGLRPGGFGIFMTRELVDELIYNEAGNEVLLIKYLP
jgi:CheY-like chemotaxis protein/anti-sigma regulatory factor (Ser/Thr protein kinase)